jgi:hypothetical protein
MNNLEKSAAEGNEQFANVIISALLVALAIGSFVM